MTSARGSPSMISTGRYPPHTFNHAGIMTGDIISGERTPIDGQCMDYPNGGQGVDAIDPEM